MRRAPVHGGRAHARCAGLAALSAAAFLLFPLTGAGAQPVDAQTSPCRAPVLETASLPAVFEPGGSFSLQFSVANPNGPRVDVVQATITTIAPAGWSAIPGQPELTLGPRNWSLNQLTIAAPNRGGGEAAGNITLVVTFVCKGGGGEFQTSASSSVVLPVAMSTFSVPWTLVLGGFLVVVAGVALLALRRARRGVVISPPVTQRPIHPGRSAKFTFTVENRRGRPVQCHLLAAGLPEGWAAHLALETVDLEPGEEKLLWAIVKAPSSASPGTEATLLLRLESRRGGRDAGGASASLQARVELEA